MSIMDAIKKGFFSANKLLKVIGIFFIFNAAVSMLSVPLSDPARAGDPMIMAVSILSSVLFFLLFIFLQGGALGMVCEQIKTSKHDLKKFTEYGKKFYLRILGLLLMYILIAILVVLLLGLVSAGILLIGDNTFTRVIVALLVTFASLGIISLLIYPIYAIVADDLGPIEAFKKGVATSLNNFLKTLGLFTSLLFMSLIISFIIGAIAGAITIPLGVNAGQYVIAIVNGAVQSYIPIVMMVAFMGIYMDLAGGIAKPGQFEASPGQAL